MGRQARAYTGRAALPFVLAICAVGVFLSHPILGRIWHPPLGSPFAAATPNQFTRAFSSRYPNGSVLAYRVVGTDGLAITKTGPDLSLWEAQVRQREAGARVTGSVVLSQQIPHLPESPRKVPLAVSELASPPVLVAYVTSPGLWSEEGSSVIRWSGGLVSHVVLGGRPRAWILPPPATPLRGEGAAEHPTWQSVELLTPLGQPLVTLTPKGATWPPQPLSVPAGFYGMPGASPW